MILNHENSNAAAIPLRTPHDSAENECGNTILQKTGLTTGIILHTSLYPSDSGFRKKTAFRLLKDVKFP